jgi:hypothetical protein
VRLREVILFALGILLLDFAIDFVLAFPFAVTYLGNYQFQISNGWYWQISTDGAFWSITPFFSNYIIRYIFVYFVVPGLFCIVGLLLIKVPKNRAARILLLYLGASVLLNILFPFTVFEFMRVTFPPIINLLMVMILQYLFWYLLLCRSQSREITSIRTFVLGVLLISYVISLLFMFPKSLQFLGNYQFGLSNAWFWEFSLDGNLFYYLSPLLINSFIIYIIIYVIFPLILFIPGQLLLGSSLKGAFRKYLIYGLPATLFVNLLLTFAVLPLIVSSLSPIILWLIFLSLNAFVWKMRIRVTPEPKTIIIL